MDNKLFEYMYIKLILILIKLIDYSLIIIFSNYSSSLTSSFSYPSKKFSFKYCTKS